MIQLLHKVSIISKLSVENINLKIVPDFKVKNQMYYLSNALSRLLIYSSIIIVSLCFSYFPCFGFDFFGQLEKAFNKME